ncbi:MAG: serine hydrolase [Bryobacteraceae bacterium]
MNLALLPHLCDLLGVSGLTNVTSQIFAPPIGFLTSNGVSPDTRLQGIIDRRVLTNSELAKLRFALVDLTDPDPLPARAKSKIAVRNIDGSLTQPAVVGIAGKDLTKQGGLGSMAKLACMWAAFQLKFDVQSLEKQVRTNNEERLFDQGGVCRRFWDLRQRPNSTNVQTLHPANPRIELHGSLVMMDGQTGHENTVIPIPVKDGADYPDLFRVFDVTPGSGVASVSFLGSSLMPVLPPGSQASSRSAGVTAYMRRGGESLTEALKLKFWERLYLMIDESDNACAHACIQNVGYLYIASLLWQSGLFSPDRNGGLWEGGSHDGRMNWIKAPVPKGDPGNDKITGTAASIAALLTALAQNRLVNKDACDGMLFLTDILRSGRFLSSFFKDGLTAQGIHLDRCHAKVGVGTNDNDCALIERTVAGKKIRYVAAGFDAPVGNAVPLHRLIVQLDNCIQEYNGLKGPGDP